LIYFRAKRVFQILANYIVQVQVNVDNTSYWKIQYLLGL